MNMPFIRFFWALCIFSLVACSPLSPKAEYIPDNAVLPNATIGKPYFFKIFILGGAVIGGKQIRAGFVHPDDSGISLRNCKLPASVITADTVDTNDHNCVEIYGTPTKAGVIKINIGGGMYGDMLAPAGNFSKDYTLNVDAS